MPTLPGLLRRRQRAILTQQDLADQAGVARSTVISLERLQKSARPATIRKLAAALDCEPRDLLTR